MDEITESATGESIIFEMDLDIEEDVDACLAEFVYRVRLGLHEDAYYLAEKILSQHIGYFPVFAELAAFFITKQEVGAASELIIDLAARRIVFLRTDEQEFHQMVALFARHRLYDSTLAALSHKEKLKLETSGSGNGVRALCSPFLEIDYNSIAQLQNIEIRLYDVLVMGQYGSLSDVVGFAFDHIQKLIGLSLLREATEILLYMSVYLHNTGQEYDIVNLYSNLSELLEQRSKTSAANHEIKDVLLTKTMAKTALFIALRGKVQSPPAVGLFEDIDELFQDIEDSTNILFSMIADTKPPRSLINRLLTRWHLWKHPPLAEKDVSVQGRSDVSDATNVEHAREKGVQPLDEKTNLEPTGNYLIEPDGPVYIQKPKAATYIQSSREDVYVQIPQEAVYVQAPEQETYVQGPQETVYVQQPEQVTYVQAAKDTVYVQAPQQVTYVQSPKDTVYVQRPEEVTYVQEPQDTVYVQEPAQITYIQQPQEAVYVHEPKGPVRIYEPEGDVHIYASKAQIHLYEPAEIHIHKSHQNVNVYEHDAHVDKDNDLLHAHDDLEEQEPLPPYTADYKIPEKIVLNQRQKLYEMGVIKSMVEKLPDPPEYTGLTSSEEMGYDNAGMLESLSALEIR